jgi:hypothetical protein
MTEPYISLTVRNPVYVIYHFEFGLLADPVDIKILGLLGQSNTSPLSSVYVGIATKT